MSKKARAFVGVLVFVLASLCVAGCAGYNIASTTPRPTAAPAADQARVYFMKPGGSFGNAQGFVLLEDKVIGYLLNRQVFYVDVPAGEHMFMSVTSNADGLKANLAGGKTYYVRLFSTPGAMSMMVGGSENMYMAPITPGTEEWNKRMEWLDGARLVEMNQAKCAQWEAKYAAKNAERLANFKSGAAEAKVLTPEAGE
jgi:hypothetical protein